MSTMETLYERILQLFVGGETAETSPSGDPSSASQLEDLVPGFETEAPDTARRQSASSQRVSRMSVVLAEALGQPEEWQRRLREAALLHDLGKLWIADEILDKPGPLTEEEREMVEKHTLVGAALLSGGSSKLLRMASRIARFHHERWDGDGYPDGLEGEEIPLSARIVAVADAFDAMTHRTPYRDALSAEGALGVIEEEAGAQFDPQVSEAALRQREELAALV